MTAAQALAVAIAVATPPWLAIAAMTLVARRRYRRQIRAIRDDAAAAAEAGLLPPGIGVAGYLAVLDTIAADVNWSDTAAVVAVLPHLACPGADDPAGEDDNAEPDQVSARLAGRVRAAVRSYLRWGHPAGWLWLAIHAPADGTDTR